MYTSYIGEKFLHLYNRKMNVSLSAAAFFEQVMFPIFFDDEKHLMHVSNSPFFQNPAEKRLKESGLTKSKLQFQDLKEKIAEISKGNRDSPDASIYVGFAADGPFQTTAGQVTSLKVRVGQDEIYSSWIGNALAIRVEGSQCLLTDSEQILWHLFEGWQYYRRYLQQTPQLEGRQIETWNGQWLANGRDLDSFSPDGKDKKLNTNPWIEVLYAFSTFHPQEVLPVYTFSLGQTNTTVGFINFHLPQVSNMGQLARTIVELKDKNTAQLWRDFEGEYRLIDGIRFFGEIGLKALKPKDFAKLLEGKMEQTKISDKNIHQFAYFKLWIIAMLNNKTELQALAAELASAFYQSETENSQSSRGKNTDTLIKAILEAKILKQFVERLTDLLDEDKGLAPAARKAVDEALKVPGETFPLFKALLRFEYVYLKKSK